jgi:hypothetical protein
LYQQFVASGREKGSHHRLKILSAFLKDGFAKAAKASTQLLLDLRQQ